MVKIEQVFSKISDSIDKGIKYLVFLLLGSMVVLTTLQIIFRAFFTSLSWSEEATRYLLVWSTFFAATLAYKRGNHIAITFVVNLFKEKIKKIIITLGYILSIAFFLLVIIYGFKMIKIQTFQTSAAMGIPMRYIYLAIPISLSIMVIHAINGIFTDINKHNNQKEST